MKINEKIGLGHTIGIPRQILRIMKFTILIMTVFLLQVSATTKAQITLSAKQESLRKVLKSISKQSGYDFVYTDQDLNKAKPVDLKLDNASIENALKACFEGQPLVYEVSDRTVMVKEKEPSLLDKLSNVILNLVQDLNVKGKVTDQDGKPLPNASIRVKGKSAVTNTNAEGEFEIKNVADDAVLLVSYVGFRTLELSLKDAVMPLEIKLNVATGELQEVKIEYSTGYQTLNKERATGSFVQIDNDLINRSTSTNILDRIIGVSNGLNFEPRGGERALTIRGVNTINANPRALIVVDGFPYDESNNNVNTLNNINPNDVESITILKDAAAASIWGSRSGNGVIVITTKQGKFNQKVKVQLNANVTIGNPPDLSYEPQLSSKDVIEFEKYRFATGYYNQFDDLYTPAGLFPPLSPVAEILLSQRRGAITNAQAHEQLNILSNHDVRDDINKYITQKSINEQYNLNLSGGSSSFKYYGSVGYDNNRSNKRGDRNDRLTIRYDNTYKPISNLELNGFIFHVQSEGIGNSISYSGFSPYTLLADSEGNPLSVAHDLRLNYAENGNFPAKWVYIPLQDQKLNNNSNRILDTRLGAGIKYNLIPSLDVTVKYQYHKTIMGSLNILDRESYEVRNLVNQFAQNIGGVITLPIPYAGITDRSNTEQNSWNLRGQLNFNQNWRKHSVNLLAGAEASETISDSFRIRSYGYNPQIGTYISNIDYNTIFKLSPSGNFTDSRIPNPIDNRSNLYRYLSYFANGGYTFKERYTFTASARFDGANMFGIKANQRIVPLWSVGALWDVSNEKFYNVIWLSSLKLRATYGYNGNTNNGATAYSTISYMPASPSSFNNSSYAVINTPPNPQLRWEKIRVLNLGIDFQMKNQRISGSIEYYRKKGIDLLGPILLDPSTGYTSFNGNQANNKSKGFDLTINTMNTTGTIKWSSNINFSYNRDIVTNYNLFTETAAGRISQQPTIGKPLFSIFSYKWAGLDPMNGDPRGYVGDAIATYDNVLSGNNAKPEDLVYHGTQNPLMFGSIRNTFSWRELTLSFNMLYKFNYYFRRNSINYSDLFRNNNLNGHIDYLDRWKKPGDERYTKVPSLPAAAITTRQNFYNNSEILIEKGDHIRLQDIRFSYELSKRKTSPFPFQDAQVFLYANNIGILWRSNRKGIDPDFGDTIPTPRSISIGLNIKL